MATAFCPCTQPTVKSSLKFTIDHLLGDQGQATKSSPSSFDPSVNQQPNEKPHRRRSTFTALQVHVLENEFFKHRYVSPEKRAGLAAFLGLSQQQVKIWFQNRRYKSKTKCTKSEAEHPHRSEALLPLRGPAFGIPLQATPINSLWFLQRRAEIFNDLARHAIRTRCGFPPTIQTIRELPAVDHVARPEDATKRAIVADVQ